MALKSLSEDQIKDFKKKGFVQLKGVFTQRRAREVRVKLRELRESFRPDRDRDSDGRYLILKRDPISKLSAGIIETILPTVDALLFRRSDRERGPTPLETKTIRKNTYREGGFDWWVKTLPGFAPKEGTWHVDGNWDFKNRCPKVVGLIGLFIFSKVGCKDGTTRVDVGSHPCIARRFSRFISEKDDIGSHEPLQVEYLTGNPGDVYLFHPMLVHDVSPNNGGSTRIAVFTEFHLTAGRLRLDEDCSLMEEPIREARKRLDHSSLPPC